MSDGYSGGFWKNVLGDVRHYSNNAAGNIQSGVDVLSGGTKAARPQSAAQGQRYAAVPDVGTTDERRDALRKKYSAGSMSKADYEKQMQWLDYEDKEEAKRKANSERAAAELRAMEEQKKKAQAQARAREIDKMLGRK